MIELTPDNVAAYLGRRGIAGPIRAELLGGGVSNAVLRVETPDRVFVLKQSRPQLRTRDPWFSDLSRVLREQEVMRLLHPLLPPLAVPEVLFTDPGNFAFAMEHAPAESRVWKPLLLAGEVDLGVGERAGALLGRMHEATSRDVSLLESFADRTVFVQLRVDPFYRRVQERRPEVATAVEPLVDSLLSSADALCHGDFSPKNLLLHDVGLTLVDYETAHRGDPTMDLGFCLSHLVLKAFHRPHDGARYLELTRAFWRGYREERGVFAAESEARACGHFAACALARIDGTSPVDYLTTDWAREAVRVLARIVLLERVTRWEDVLAVASERLSA